MLRPAALACALLLSASSSAAAQNVRPSPDLADIADGASIYQARCATCHGASGRGDGPAAAFLNPRPRDFTSGRYKFRSTETGSLPTDDDLAASIVNGLHGTSMPAWAPFLSTDQVKAVVGHLKTFSPRFASEQPRQISMAVEPQETPEQLAGGRRVYEVLKCGACHGTDGMGSGAIAQILTDDIGRPVRATNLSEPWTFRGGNTVRDIFLRFRTGMNGTPMPSFLGAASEPELWQLALYVRSMGRRPLWEMTPDEVATFYRDRKNEESKDRVRHGAYVATIAGCAFCHSPFRDDDTMIEPFRFAGGQRFRAVPFGDFVSYNLTSDRETGLGGWMDDQIKGVVTRGERPDGSRMIPYPMPWPSYASMTPEDLDALVAFLRSLPPVSNRIPPPQQPNLLSYLAGKFRLLVLRQDPPLYIYPGNAGAAGGAR